MPPRSAISNQRDAPMAYAESRSNGLDRFSLGDACPDVRDIGFGKHRIPNSGSPGLAHLSDLVGLVGCMVGVKKMPEPNAPRGIAPMADDARRILSGTDLPGHTMSKNLPASELKDSVSVAVLSPGPQKASTWLGGCLCVESFDQMTAPVAASASSAHGYMYNMGRRCRP